MSLTIDCRQQPTQQQVGGKFARQAELIAAGLPVPRFVCLTRDFYTAVTASVQAQIHTLLSAIDFTDHASILQGSRAAQQLIEALALAPEHQNCILAAFDAHFALDTLVSVRASTVGHKLEESEDSISNPFAGMSESFLYVRRDQIMQRVKACWASGFSPESLIYRHQQQMDLMGFSVAVGIQEMVFGERSFVMFTADPKTAASDQIIIAGYGIGEGVVQEKVAVDHYFISGKSASIQHTIADKTRQLVFDEDAGFGLKETPVPDDQQTIPCLTDQEIRQLVEIGKRVESLYGLPQDIEGTFTVDGRFHLLQTRPIALDFERQLVWSNTNVTESYPGISSTLTYTHAKFFYRVIFRDLYKRLGVADQAIWNHYQPLDNMIGYLNGRIYYCLSHFYQLHKLSPLFPLFAAHWENMIGLRSSFHTQPPRSFTAWLKKGWDWARFGKALVLTLTDFLGHDRAMYHYHRWWEQRIAPLRGQSFSGTDPLTLVKRFHELWTEVGRHWGVTLTTDAYLIPLYGWTEALFKKWKLDQDEPGLLSDLLCGDEQLQSVEIILSAVNLAEQVRADATLQATFNQSDEQALWQALDNNELNPAFTQAVRRHLHVYGDRGLQELKVEQPSLRDTPWVLLKMIRQYANQDVTVASYRKHELAVRASANQTLQTLLQDQPWKLTLLNRVILPRLRRLIRHRENSRYCRSELFGFSKQIFKALAEYFVQRGILRDANDIVHLTQDEIFGYINGMGVTENLQALADLRRAEYEQFDGAEPAEQITTLGAVRDNDLCPPQAIAPDGDTLQGLGSSAGKVRGIARVVNDPNTVDTTGDNMILIARETDPGWLFLMLASKGMVVERGSMLSHTAITGRKFGIPTIVALPNATQRIPDGALIELDGSSGVVTILEQPGADNTAKGAAA
ncbi:MAG: PEP/pyruvate-binding domain-containing protein [Pseudomonadota bacterium]|nr:PEP/pyruvate-binding domain-containing protein [Pseudomonadota bacterium]